VTIKPPKNPAYQQIDYSNLGYAVLNTEPQGASFRMAWTANPNQYEPIMGGTPQGVYGTPGLYSVTFRKDGYEPSTMQVYLAPRQTITYPPMHLVPVTPDVVPIQPQAPTPECGNTDNQTKFSDAAIDFCNSLPSTKSLTLQMANPVFWYNALTTVLGMAQNGVAKKSLRPQNHELASATVLGTVLGLKDGIVGGAGSDVQLVASVPALAGALATVLSNPDTYRMAYDVASDFINNDLAFDCKLILQGIDTGDSLKNTYYKQVLPDLYTQAGKVSAANNYNWDLGDKQNFDHDYVWAYHIGYIAEQIIVAKGAETGAKAGINALKGIQAGKVTSGLGKGALEEAGKAAEAAIKRLKSLGATDEVIGDVIKKGGKIEETLRTGTGSKGTVWLENGSIKENEGWLHVEDKHMKSTGDGTKFSSVGISDDKVQDKIFETIKNPVEGIQTGSGNKICYFSKLSPGKYIIAVTKSTGYIITSYPIITDNPLKDLVCK